MRFEECISLSFRNPRCFQKDSKRHKKRIMASSQPNVAQQEHTWAAGSWPDLGTNLPGMSSFFHTAEGTSTQRPERVEELHKPPRGHQVDKDGTCGDTQETLHSNSTYTTVIQWTSERRVRVCTACGWPVQIHTQRMDANTATADHFRKETQIRMHPWLKEWEMYSTRYDQTSSDPQHFLESIREKLKDGEVQPVVYLMYLFLVVDLTPKDRFFVADNILFSIATGEAQSVIKAVNFVLARKRDNHWLATNGGYLFKLRNPLMPHPHFLATLENRMIGEVIHPTGGEDAKRGFPLSFPGNEARKQAPRLVVGGAVHLPLNDNNGQWFADATCLEQPIQALIQRVTALEAGGTHVNYKQLGEVIAAELRSNRSSQSSSRRQGAYQVSNRGPYNRGRHNVRGAGEEEDKGNQRQASNDPESLRNEIFGVRNEARFE